jgi:hypothetical protein
VTGSDSYLAKYTPDIHRGSVASVRQPGQRILRMSMPG